MAKDTKDLELSAQEQLLKLRMDRTLQLRHNEMDISSYWVSIGQEYPDIARRAIGNLSPFATTYLYESAFSTLTLIRNKKRSNVTAVEQELLVCLSDVKPRIQKLCAKK